MAHIELVEARLAGQDRVQVRGHRLARSEHVLLVAVEDGGGAGDSGAHGQNFPADFRRHGLRQFRVFGPRAHETHVPLQHIPQLGQFVEFGGAKPTAERRHARVALRREARPPVAFRALVHGAELQDAEHLTALTQSRPTVEHGTGRIAFDPDGDQQKERREKGQQQRRNAKVHRPLGRGLAQRGGLVANLCRRVIFQCLKSAILEYLQNAEATPVRGTDHHR